MKLNNTVLLFSGYISSLICLLPVVVGFIRIKTLVRELRVLFLFCILAFVFDVTSGIVGLYTTNNLFLFHIFTPVEFILLSGVYYYKAGSQRVRILIDVVLIFFLILVLLDSLYFDKIKTVDSISSATESFLLMLYSLFFFYHLLKTLEYKNLFDNPMFWFNSGVLIYFSGTFILFIFSNYMLSISDAYFDEMWFIHDVLNIAMNTLFSIALWKR